jgi:outer membrane protein
MSSKIIFTDRGHGSARPYVPGKTGLAFAARMATILVLIFAASFQTGFSQRFAYVDSDYILNNIPEYRSAQERLDKLSEEWQKEVEARYQEVESLYRKYQQDRVLMSDEMQRKREEEIVSREAAAAELQRKYFGPGGELFKSQEELLRPIQDRVYNAVVDMANDGNYAVIFDTADSQTMLYTNPRHDMSDDVLKRLGYRN